MPASPNRCPSEPFGTTRSPVRASTSTVLKWAFSTAACSGRSAAVRNLAGRWAPSGPASSDTRCGRSVYCFVYSLKYGVSRSTKNSLRMTWPIDIARAPSVPGLMASHSSANFTLSA